MIGLSWLRKTAPLLGLAGLLLAGFTANANTLTLVDNAVVVTAGPGTSFTWHYHVDWANSTIQFGDFITLTGAAGITSAPDPDGPGGWTATVSAGFTSVTWTWADADRPLGPGSGTLPEPFTYVSKIGTAVQGNFTSQDHVNTPPGGTSGAFGHVTVAGIAPVPDGGSTVALLGFALMALGGLHRKLRK